MNQGTYIIWIRINHVTKEWVMSHRTKSRHLETSHITYSWIMSHPNESCHTSTGHVTYQRVMSHINESCHISTSHVTHQRVTYACGTPYTTIQLSIGCQRRLAKTTWNTMTLAFALCSSVWDMVPSRKVTEKVNFYVCHSPRPMKRSHFLMWFPQSGKTVVAEVWWLYSG